MPKVAENTNVSYGEVDGSSANVSLVSDIVRRRLRFRAHTAETLAFLLSSLWNHSDGGHDTLSGYFGALDSHVRAGGGCMGELHFKQRGSDTKDSHEKNSEENDFFFIGSVKY